jgi:hypothetical protein
MLKYIYPNNWQELTFHLEDEVNNKNEETNVEKQDVNNIDLSKVKGWEE